MLSIDVGPVVGALLGWVAMSPFIAAGALFAYLQTEIIFSAVLRGVNRDLPVDFAPSAYTLTIRAKLLLFVPTISAMTAFLAVGLAGARADAVQRLAAAIIVASLISATLALVLTWMVSRSLADPVGRLTTGAEQVRRGDLTAHVPPQSGDEIATLAITFNQMVAGLRQREALHSAVSAYIDPVIAERVADEGSVITGEAADVTIMFIDIVGYTSMAEYAEPEAVVSDLNEFFELVIPAIVRHQGHANKLLGDGLMAVFGVPNAVADHADQASAASREIRAVLADRYAGTLKAGIGLNSGMVVAGSMGGGPS